MCIFKRVLTADFSYYVTEIRDENVSGKSLSEIDWNWNWNNLLRKKREKFQTNSVGVYSSNKFFV